MKVLLINGSPHEQGSTARALQEVLQALRGEGVEGEIYWIGDGPVQGCKGCWQCKQPESEGCVVRDQVYTELVAKVEAADAIVIGSPVYYAGPAGSLCALLDRVCFSKPKAFRYKPAACVVNCRRGGASAAFDRLNKYFTILQMPVVSSVYWNSTHGFTPAQVEKDAEGLLVMRTLGRNMAHMLQAYAAANLARPATEKPVFTNFID